MTSSAQEQRLAFILRVSRRPVQQNVDLVKATIAYNTRREKSELHIIIVAAVICISL